MAAGLSSMDIHRKYEQLLTEVADNPGWVAFSGGVDSTLLLQALVEVRPAHAVALFADSLLQSQVDRENARSIADQLRAQLRVVSITPLLWPEFVVNPRNRCYFCKSSVYRRFQALLPQEDLLLDGTNLDDLKACRPGQRAIVELGVVSPLARVGLTKAEIREVARRLGLPNWNRPSSSCLATRIPEGFAILPELLRHVEAGEQLIRAQGFGHVRMRLNNGRPEDVTVELAREELDGPDFPARCDRLDQGLRGLGIVRLVFVGREEDISS